MAEEKMRRALAGIRVSAQEAARIAERVRGLSSLRDELGGLASELAALAGIRADGGENPPNDPLRERPAVQSAQAAAAADRVYQGSVEVEVGPLRDFAQLTSFEDAAAEIDSASSVVVSKFADGRATFSINFAQPVELVRELEQRAPFPFSVRAVGTDALVLDVDAPRDAA